jgi:hypothetical protein
MSVSFRWRPVADSKDIGAGTSTDHSVLAEVFGESPWTFEVEDLKQLRAMAAAKGGAENLYAKIADLVERHGSIQVTAAY